MELNAKLQILKVIITIVVNLSDSARINYKEICGQHLVESCSVSSVVNTKVVGGESTCAERVPWNVLVENIKLERMKGHDT